MTSHEPTAAALSRDEVLTKLRGLLRQILKMETMDAILPEARLAEDLNIDSLGMVDVVIGVEETFGLRMQSDLNLFDEVKTVNDAVDLVLRQMGKAA